MIEDDVHHISKEMFDNQCFISSFSEFTDQGNLINKVDLVSSNITVPADHNDKIVSELGILLVRRKVKTTAFKAVRFIF